MALEARSRAGARVQGLAAAVLLLAGALPPAPLGPGRAEGGQLAARVDELAARVHELAARAEKRLEAALQVGEAAGAVVVAGVGERTILRTAAGWRALEPAREAMTLDTLFDLASLTKPIVTASSVVRLTELHGLDLDDPLARHVPAFAAGGKEHVSVRQLLLHRGGLAPADPLEGYARGPERAWERILASAPRGEPGLRFVYSDLGYLALGELVRAVDGRPLEEFAREELLEPIGMRDAGFQPDPDLSPRIAPTERAALGGPFLRGVVHDPRARALGGVAGHAGLFGTADDVARWCRMLLAGGELEGRRVLSEESVRALLTPSWLPDGSGGRTLAFDVDTPYSSARGARFARGRTMGHTGFTGTSLWLDPESGAYVVLLTSRLHPDGQRKLTALRSDLATLVAETVLGPAGAQPGTCAEPAAFDAEPAPVVLAPRAAERAPATGSVLCGIDVLRREGFARLSGQRVAVLTNPSGVDRAGARTIDLLHAAPDVELVRILAPEHGLAGGLEGDVPHGSDEATGLPVFSLYGETRRPTEAMLEGLDAVVFDVQDAGVRIYTYATTLAYLMEEAGRRGARVIVLDRPAPLGGQRVDGPRADPERLAFISYAPIPFVHGLTIGELARLFSGRFGVECELEVVAMQGWERRMLFADTGLRWVDPSPNLRSPTQALLYPALGLLEAANVSVGRGTGSPFELIGAPWIDGALLCAELSAAGLPGLRFEPIAFTPEESRFAGERCEGVRLVLTDPDELEAVRTGFTIAWWLERLFAADFEIARLLDRARSFAAWEALRLAGDPSEIPAVWAVDVASFEAERRAYLLYD